MQRLFAQICGFEHYLRVSVIFTVLQYKGANIQLLDLPGIIEGAAQGMLSCFKEMFIKSEILMIKLFINLAFSMKSLWGSSGLSLRSRFIFSLTFKNLFIKV